MCFDVVCLCSFELFFAVLRVLMLFVCRCCSNCSPPFLMCFDVVGFGYYFELASPFYVFLMMCVCLRFVKLVFPRLTCVGVVCFFCCVPLFYVICCCWFIVLILSCVPPVLFVL